MKKIPVLFVSKKSNYRLDNRFCVFGLENNALENFPSSPAIFHPPCRLFSKLRYFSTAPACEKLVAYASIWNVRRYGGVVEHPFDSKVWKDLKICNFNEFDEFGGILIKISQYDFGFPTKKMTALYIVGLKNLSELPQLPLRLYISEKKFDNLSPTQRSATTPLLIDWLYLLIEKISANMKSY